MGHPSSKPAAPWFKEHMAALRKGQHLTAGGAGGGAGAAGDVTPLPTAPPKLHDGKLVPAQSPAGRAPSMAATSRTSRMVLKGDGTEQNQPGPTGHPLNSYLEIGVCGTVVDLTASITMTGDCNTSSCSDGCGANIVVVTNEGVVLARHRLYSLDKGSWQGRATLPASHPLLAAASACANGFVRVTLCASKGHSVTALSGSLCLHQHVRPAPSAPAKPPVDAGKKKQDDVAVTVLPGGDESHLLKLTKIHCASCGVLPPATHTALCATKATGARESLMRRLSLHDEDSLGGTSYNRRRYSCTGCRSDCDCSCDTESEC